jgi:hypothetical protein
VEQLKPSLVWKLLALIKSLISTDFVGCPTFVSISQDINGLGMKKDTDFFQNSRDIDLHKVGRSFRPGLGVPKAFSHIHRLILLGVDAAKSSWENTWSFL